MVHTVSVLVLDHDGNLILQQRDDKPGMDGPGRVAAWGGACEPGERPIDAARRELIEETGLSVAEGDLRFWRKYKKTKEKHGSSQTVHVFVLIKSLDPSALTVNEGQGYYVVEPGDDLSGINLSPLAREFVQDFFVEKQRR